jgi:hypothetical protein
MNMKTDMDINKDMETAVDSDMNIETDTETVTDIRRLRYWL